MPLSPNDFEQLKTLSVLYVEDEKEVLDLLAMFLKRRVGTLITAANGKEGLDAYFNHKPDIVVTDISMPVMGGLDMAEAIKRDNYDVPVLITTAFNEPDFLRRSIEIGVDNYVVKPVNPDNLLESLSKGAQVLFKHRLIEAHNRLVRFVLDASSDLMVLMSDDGADMVNQAFLRYLGYDSEEDFEKSPCTCQLDGQEVVWGDGKCCLKVIRDNPGTSYQVDVFSRRDDKELSFEVVYHRFEELNKFLFAFTPLSLHDE